MFSLQTSHLLPRGTKKFGTDRLIRIPAGNQPSIPTHNTHTMLDAAEVSDLELPLEWRQVLLLLLCGLGGGIKKRNGRKKRWRFF